MRSLAARGVVVRNGLRRLIDGAVFPCSAQLVFQLARFGRAHPFKLRTMPLRPVEGRHLDGRQFGNSGRRPTVSFACPAKERLPREHRGVTVALLVVDVRVACVRRNTGSDDAGECDGRGVQLMRFDMLEEFFCPAIRNLGMVAAEHQPPYQCLSFDRLDKGPDVASPHVAHRSCWRLFVRLTERTNNETPFDRRPITEPQVGQPVVVAVQFDVNRRRTGNRMQCVYHGV